MVHAPYFVPRAWAICVDEAAIVTWVILLERLVPEFVQRNCRAPGCLPCRWLKPAEALADLSVGAGQSSSMLSS